jgi:hypothetical protein
MKAVYSLLLLALFCFNAAAAEGEGIVFVQKENRNGKTALHQVQMDRTHMKVESSGNGNPVTYIFDAEAQIARMISFADKTYIEMTRGDLDMIKKQIADMEEQLEKLPSGQRMMMEQVMRERGMPAQVVKIQYRESGSDQIGPWTCKSYDGYRGSLKVAEVCTVEPATLGLAVEDFAVTRQFVEFAAMLSGAGDQMIVNGTAEDQGFSGIPVRRISIFSNAIDSVSQITDIRHEALLTSTFETPAGFTRKPLPAFGK